MVLLIFTTGYDKITVTCPAAEVDHIIAIMENGLNGVWYNFTEAISLE